ncbi:chitin biosynthesis protein CHS5 [Ophiocordyceps camponoti-floridani]|uniref:Chitin biosynthesis protein CHS5 n=1 Tax=Ophiocordyceps camponoti-floridani TaxID=2030778 RepID=A0A8H4VFF6_9HYPO|nr:chitin biosynthesis protein CHS5 [Ophiocordyceps camponoti-floridani]
MFITRHSRLLSTLPRTARPYQTMASGKDAPTMESIGVRNSTVNTGPGVTLTAEKKLLVGSVLDLFEGHPSLKHLSLWQRSASFEDPIAIAKGYDGYAAQWYGLPVLFNPIKIRSHTVTSGGNPMDVSLSNAYTVKGIKSEHVIDSTVRIYVGEDGKIEKVEDKWNMSTPLVGTSVGDAFRKLSSNTTSKMVKVPKTEEEDRKMQAERGD